MKKLSSLLLSIPFLLAGCGADMKPKRPYAVPFDLSTAGYVSKFEIEVLEPNVGVSLTLVFHFQDDAQRKYLLDAVMKKLQNPELPHSPQNPKIGQIAPLHVKVTRGQEIIFDGVRMTKDARSLTAATPGYLNRSIWGMVLAKGKYQIQITNLQVQPVFTGYKVEINIPGDSKV